MCKDQLRNLLFMIFILYGKFAQETRTTLITPSITQN